MHIMQYTDQLPNGLAARPPLLAFVGRRGAGKTTLLTALVPILAREGLRVGVAKQACDFEIDHPGKDSFRLRKAGAAQTLVVSPERWALIGEAHHGAEHAAPRLADLLARLDWSRLDLILAEGFGHERVPKVEVHRPDLGYPLLFPTDGQVVALATNRALSTPCPLPLLPLDDPARIAEFVVAGAQVGWRAPASGDRDPHGCGEARGQQCTGSRGGYGELPADRRGAAPQ